jgi:hypothetical protein
MQRQQNSGKHDKQKHDKQQTHQPGQDPSHQRQGLPQAGEKRPLQPEQQQQAPRRPPQG